MILMLVTHMLHERIDRSWVLVSYKLINYEKSFMGKNNPNCNEYFLLYSRNHNNN